ncbi:MAG: bifunctional tetrahydrofolate synthase/dihydrofolate synthase, partial [Thiohalobacterales bacterium]|nr:bifunctional tetrahydrofolate synthase/dihydrofolate synthase [Thiohalobacterales bacterium]
MPRFSTLDDWLGWQETLHPDPIELGLARVGEVAARLGLLSPPATVISVAGTNGKGSSVAMLDAIYRAAGYRTGVYTSPHLLKYNERIRVDGREIDDAGLCAAFERIDAARGDVSLTYFEFGTLAALDIFSRARPDIIILEVGMGGRLDAVNIIDADVALVTAIGIDHSAWLGNDREAIGREKAGIYREGRPAICSDPAPPATLEQTARAVGAGWRALGEHFDYRRSDAHWQWQGNGRRHDALPLPALQGRQQLDNAAGVIMATEVLQVRHPVPVAALAEGLRGVSLAGRCQLLPGRIERVLDVAHNLDSARLLAAWLADHPATGETWLVLGMLADKDAAGLEAILSPVIDHWCLAGLPGERGLPAGELAAMA